MCNQQKFLNVLKIVLFFVIYLVLNGANVRLFGDTIDFDSGQWQIVNGKVIDHLGRKAFHGTAFLKGLEFEDGVIEVDIAVTGARSYPGIRFRIQSRKDYEWLYIRPHRAGLYPDALQYAPSINGIGEWQLCNGDGYTAPTTLQKNDWIHLKIEVLKNRARVFIGDNPKPALKINNLKHGISKGTIGLNGPPNGTAYFSNFQYRKTDKLTFENSPIQDLPVGMIMDWEISQSFKALDIDMKKTPDQQGLTSLKWKKTRADPSGLVDVGKYTGRSGRAPDLIFAKTNFLSTESKLLELNFGYSDYMTIFINGTPVFFGNSAYQSRDRSFVGVIGLNDTVFLPLKKGKNELLVMVAESFGGWGFMFQDANAIFKENGMKKIWETEKVFKTSESVLYDPKREVLYVSNFDQFNIGNPKINQFISKLSLDGKTIKLKWIEGLNNPLGMTIYKDRLYVAERNSIAVINLKKEKLDKRLPVKGSVFLNDIAIDKRGTIYVSDSRKHVIWRSKGKSFVEWLKKPEISDPNVLYIQKNDLIIGNSGDQQLKSVNVINKSIKTLARFPKGFIDGIRPDGFENLLVSLWDGKIFRVHQKGDIKLILNTKNTGSFTADFEYIPEKNLLIIPTFFKNKVVAYKLNNSN